MWFIYILLGIIAGFLLAWYFLGRQFADSQAETERHWNSRLDAANDELRSATEDNQEIKGRLISLQEEHQLCGGRIADAEQNLVAAQEREMAADTRAADAIRARDDLQRQLDHAKTALANERARASEVQSRLEEARASEGSAPLAGIDAPSPSLALHEAPANFEGEGSRAAGSASGAVDAISAEEAARSLRRLDGKIAQLPAGSSARRALEAEREKLLASAGATTTRPKSGSGISSPTSALMEARTGFIDDSAAAALPAISAEAMGERRRLRALDAKIAQLPAGSSARRQLEAERRAMTGTSRASGNGRPQAEPSSNRDEPEALFERPMGEPDDLKQIKGVGPVLEQKLHRLGITRFSQIAAFTSADIARVDDVLDFKGRIEREDWIGQARALERS